MKRYLLPLLILAVMLWCATSVATAQAWTPTPDPVAVSGTVIKVTNPYGGYNASFEEIFTGSPATVSVTIQGCSRANTCDTAVDTNASSSAQIRFVTFSKAYNYFKVTPTWTGGTAPTFTIYPIVTTARTGSGSLVNATFDVPTPVLGNTGIFQYKIQTNGLLLRISCSTDQGTASINLDLRTEAAPNAPGTSALGSDLSCTSSTGVTTTIANPQYLANAPISLLISALAGSPSILRVHVASVSN